MNVGGDGNDVWPWTSRRSRDRFDVSKLDRWEIVFSQMDKLGILLHVVTQETENNRLLNRGNLGKQRRLYYRELIARFGHHLGLIWNLGEENTNTSQQLRDFANYIRHLDPYQHPIVVHTHPPQKEKVYTPLLGFQNFEGPSLQVKAMKKTHRETIKWLDKSAKSDRQWFVSLDEIGPANIGVKPDANNYWHNEVRKEALWGNLMAGGAGVEWYFGYQYPHNDLDCEDWRSRSHMWDLTRYALEFFHDYLPFAEMKHDDRLASNSNAYVLAKEGEVYAIYLKNGGTTNLELPAGNYTVRWYNPRTGGVLKNGSIASVSGSRKQSIGNPPSDRDKDWVALLTSSSP